VTTGVDLRFDQLETVREYGLELLGEERAAVEHALAVYMAELLARAVLKGPGLTEWLQRLDAELDNLRVALDRAALEPDVELELELAGRVWRYWWIRGAMREGLARLDAALERSQGHETAARARALAGAGGLAWSTGDNARATESRPMPSRWRSGRARSTRNHRRTSS
jgi:non-specific serine/threonine protein kinase